MEIVQAIPEDSKNIALIHYNNFKNAFLCDLGLNFLKLLYKWLITSDNGFGFIIKDNGCICGFITGVYDSSSIISLFIKKNFLKVFPILITACLKKPKNITKIFETIFYIKKSDINIKAELLSIAIENNKRGKGISKILFSHFAEYLKKQGINSFKITVDKENIVANNFYIKCGCELIKTYKIYGKFSNVYSFIIK